MTSGRSHFGEESLRSKRSGHTRAGNVYDSWDDDDDEVTVQSHPIAGRGVGMPPPGPTRARSGRRSYNTKLKAFNISSFRDILGD